MPFNISPKKKGNKLTLQFCNSSHPDQKLSYSVNHILYSDIYLAICLLTKQDLYAEYVSMQNYLILQPLVSYGGVFWH